jgi:integral membrane protein
MTSLNLFRKVALAEGISYILLLAIGMPLKYGFDLPLVVKYMGWAHGILFILGKYTNFTQKEKINGRYGRERKKLPDRGGQ